MDIGWVKTADHLTVVVNGDPISIKKGAPRYEPAMKHIRKNDKKGLMDFLFPAKKIEEKTNFKVQGEKVVNKTTGEQLESVLAHKLANFVERNLPFRPLTKFFENIEKNPNPKSRDQLFEYLKHNHFPITDDGCFLAYKYVTELPGGKLVDSYTKTYDNSVGKTVTEDRAKCDPNPNITCSRGLHVAAYPYAHNCGGGEVMIEVKVNPKDVVAVPIDYSSQKMRVCRYEILCRGEKEISEHYRRIKNNQPKEESSSTPGLPDFNLMSGSQIIAYVKEKTGKVIPISPKSKKSVIKHALLALNFENKITTMSKIYLGGLSSSQIIDLVFDQTGNKITLSPKSKKSVIKKAWSILTEHGLDVR